MWNWYETSFWWKCSATTAYYKKGFGNPQDYPVANKVVDSTFWIGVYPGITDEMLNFIYESTLNF